MAIQSLLQILRTAGRLRLAPRLTIIVLVLVSESALHTFVFQSVAYAGGGDARGFIQAAFHTLFRFMVAYVLFVAILAGGHPQGRKPSQANFTDAPLSRLWALVHIALLGLIAALSFVMHANVTAVDYWLLASLWLVCGVGAVAALFMSMASGHRWLMALKSFQFVLLGAFLPALATVIAFHFSQALWRPAAKITFLLVASELRLILPSLHADAGTQILGTDRFLVFIADACSGMEGLGLTLVFCTVILWFYRRDLRFPRAFVILPAALSLMFLLNSMRIASLVLIGNAGYPEVASVGFHSQAGWIAFNLVALSVAMVARRSRWLSVSSPHAAALPALGAPSDNPLAPYVMPLVISLAVGMLGKSLSAGFDIFYPTTPLAAGIALWMYRRQLRQLDWRFSWRAIAGGACVFLIWMIFDRMFNVRHGMPDALAHVPSSMRNTWILARALGAIATVPVVEELAFRGYLLRVFKSKNFDLVHYRDVRWPSLASSSMLFGLVHGAMWLPAILAGVGYGWLAIRRDRLGEAVAAHATTNALIVFAVLVFDDWELW